MSRGMVNLVRRCGEGAEWCMREQARLRDEGPGASPYTDEQLQTWAREHAEMAFRLSALYTDEPRAKARFATPLDPSPTSPGGHTLGRSRPGDGSNPSSREEPSL